MTSAAFAASLPFILRWEGGFVNHPSDPGGATNRGVTQRVYDDWREHQGLSAQDVRQITDEEVHAIYEDNYWKPTRCDVLRSRLDLIQFDTAVNTGVKRAIRMLQEAVNCPIDGGFGDGTKKAAGACDLGQAMRAYCQVREKFYRSLAEHRPELAVFLKGWLNRLNALRAEVGVPGFESATEIEPSPVERVPDIGDAAFEAMLSDPEVLRAQTDKALKKLHGTPDAGDLADAKKLVEELRSVREWKGMGQLAEAISRLDDDPKNRKLYAQSLIETGNATVAADVLRAMVQRLAPDHPERAEAEGLLGRVYKQIFLDASDKMSVVARDALRQAIKHYRGPFDRKPPNTYHGVNLLALLRRARKLGLDSAPELDPAVVARELLVALEATPEHKRDEWYFASVAEAKLALSDKLTPSDYDVVEQAIRQYAGRSEANAFAVASTLRQFTEVWGLEDEGERGQGIVAILRACLLSLPGGALEVKSADLERLRAQRALPGQPEAILGDHGAVTYAWWRTGLDRALGVVAIRRKLGNRVGTGFAVRAGDLGLTPEDEVLVMTNFHVVNPGGVTPGIAPSAAEVVFEALDASQRYPIAEIVWSSPMDRLDATVLRLRRRPELDELAPLASQLPKITEGACVYIIGHPGGRDLAFSFQDNKLLDHEGPPANPHIDGVCRVHYGAPTEPGSSGSPVFNEQWEVIALHHFGGKAGMPRLNGKTGTYGANEGIGIGSIRDAIKREGVGRAKAPGAP
jgi:lysozyme family protein